MELKTFEFTSRKRDNWLHSCRLHATVRAYIMTSKFMRNIYASTSVHKLAAATCTMAKVADVTPK
jgi:hypothetical protein